MPATLIEQKDNRVTIQFTVELTGQMLTEVLELRHETWRHTILSEHPTRVRPRYPLSLACWETQKEK